MAPSRRKGAGKAAAAAAARRQWKVGDLVLAKVKGFPAWPAKVSEPEKWGYSTDWKKVLVYFFGTQQIAFCNPADVEAFTEEKKDSLLVKRQKKGADFVRAVQEIIDSYEKSKKQDQANDINSGNDATQINDGNSGDSTMNELKDEAEVPRETFDSLLNASNSVRDSEPGLLVEDVVKQVDPLHEKDTLQDKPTESVVAAESPLLATYTSRKRSGGSRQQNSVVQRRAPPVRRSRSSSRVESGRLQNFVMSNNDGAKVGINIIANGARDGSLRRNKRIRKSPDISDYNDRGSPALASNVSAEDNGSEIDTVESGSLSLNEGSTIDSGSKLEHLDTVECLEGDLELSKGLDLQIKAVGIRKKRKPNRKRGMNEVTEHNARLGKEEGLEGGVNATSQNSQHVSEKANERHSKEDGDEHLPLLKRARVRMGKPSVEELNSLPQAEERPPIEVAFSSAGQVSSAVNCDSDGTTERNSFLVKDTSDNTSPSKNCTQFSESRPHPWKIQKSQSFGSADGEAALPPSKRLHRALEAMSANVAEEGQACIEASSTVKTSINEFCVSPTSRCPDAAVESREGNDLELENVDYSAKNYTQIGASGFPASLNPISSDETRSSVGAEIPDKPIENFTSGNQEFDKDFAPETIDCVDRSELIELSSGTHNVQIAANTESPGCLSPNLVTGQANPSLNHISFDQLLPSNDEGGREDMELSSCKAENHGKESDNSEHAPLSPDTVQGVGEITEVLPGDDTNMHNYSSEGTGCENIESFKSQVDDNCQVNGVREAVSDKVEMKGQKETISASFSSDDGSSGKVMSDVRSSPCPTDGADFPAQVSSPSALTCHISTSESANFPKTNGSSSPNVRLEQNKCFVPPVADEGKSESIVTQRPKLTSKWSNYAEAQAALSSFEAILGTLTGKKESIGRATRTAIDCGKLGVASKVVEIIARHLESESSLHRRVDLFFLVDSITQCSRNMKGDVGGVYLSAIQALLPRLLSAAAPPGNAAQENRRQCLKVLRVWLDRRILPESVVRYHMRELDANGCAFSGGAYSRRSSRTERSLDDPVREMEGMLVDEYGSNSSFQLPGFCMPRMLKDEDEGSDSDGGSFEAVTPEHKPDTPEEQETTLVVEKHRHRHVLEDVDGELEMEDVAPLCDVDMNAATNVASVNSLQSSHDQFDPPFPPPFAPPLPHDVPPSSPPLPSSPPPPPPPPPSLAPPCAMSSSYSASADSNLYMATNNMQDNLPPPVVQHSVPTRMNSTADAAHYHPPEFRDQQMHRQVPDSASSFGGFPSQPVNSVQHNDGVRFPSKPFPPRPPHPAPSDQFSYVHADQHAKSRREVPPPPSFPNRFHGMHNMGGGNYYNNHDRMKPPPYENGDNWRFHAPPYPGPRYPDKGKESYPHAPYMGPSREPTRFHNQGWSHPPRAVNHRNPMPMRHPSEAPNFWRPR